MNKIIDTSKVTLDMLIEKAIEERIPVEILKGLLAMKIERDKQKKLLIENTVTMELKLNNL